MLIRYYLKNPLASILIHIGLGFIARFQPMLLTLYFLIFAGLGVRDIFMHQDQANRTAYYVIYVTGLEIVYRIGKFYLFWELGKYLTLGLLLTGILFSGIRRKALPFLLFLLLLFPGVAVSLYYGHSDMNYLRKIILQHISGPLTLGFAGLYFSNRVIKSSELAAVLRIGVLPLIVLVSMLFFGPNISDISFENVKSNSAASGGFGPNQVSSVIGWGVVLVGFALLNRITLTLNRSVDLFLFALLVFRGLVTLSRGGQFAAIGALLVSLLIMIVIDKGYKARLGKILIQSLAGVLVLAFVVFVTNKLTNDFLYYRYMGYSTTEALYGYKNVADTRTYVSGREDIIRFELAAFADYPITGTGAGRGTLYRKETYGYRSASHTEFTRILGEHGFLGMVILLGLFILFPMVHFAGLSSTLERHFFIVLFGFTVLTMANTGMRLAFPGILYGMAFLRVVPYEGNRIKHN